MGSGPAVRAPSRSVAARLQAITEHLTEEGRVEVAALADLLDVAPETIRRDLRTLEESGRLQRVHGGAVSLPQRPMAAVSLPPTAHDHAALGALVWSELPRTGSVLLDAGRLTLAVAEAIVAAPPERTGLTVVTNSLDVAITLSRISVLTVFNLGGAVNAHTLAQEGDWALGDLADLHTDVGVLSPAGVSATDGLTHDTPAAAAVARAEVASAQRVLVLTDACSLGRSAFVHFAALDVVDRLYATSQPEAATTQPFRDRGLAIQVPA